MSIKEVAAQNLRYRLEHTERLYAEGQASIKAAQAKARSWAPLSGAFKEASDEESKRIIAEIIDLRLEAARLIQERRYQQKHLAVSIEFMRELLEVNSR